MSVKPITPQEASRRFQAQLPDYVFSAFNELLSERIGTGSRCTISQDDVIERIIKKADEMDVKLERQQIFEQHYLDIETSYREAGWEVTYHKPDYADSDEANFTFARSV